MGQEGNFGVDFKELQIDLERSRSIPKTQILDSYTFQSRIQNLVGFQVERTTLDEPGRAAKRMYEGVPGTRKV